jgi:uncharacterized repeat protein (TIGR01451 family)
MRRLVAFASVVFTVVAVGCGGGDDPTAPTATSQPPASGPTVPPPSFATASNGEGLSITTDKDDYSPGDTVWFTGAGWQAGDTVDIVLNEEPQTHDPHTWSIPVGENGGFRDSTYVVDFADIGVIFTLTATSRNTPEQSLTVQFTDGNIRAASAPSGVQFVLSRRTYTGDACTGTETALPNVTIGNPPFTTVATAGSMGQPSSAKLIAAATSTLGAPFSGWSSNSSFTIVGGDPKVICVEGGGGNFDYTATYDATADLTIAKSISGTFAVGSANAAYSFQVTNAGTATAEGAAANRITVTDVLPAGLAPPASPFSVNNWDCTVTGQTVTCRLAAGQTILPAAPRTFSFGVGIAVAACPSVTNSAAVSGGNEPSANAGNNGSGNVVTPVSGCNVAPAADAGGPYSGNEGSAIPLDGSGSTDDGTIVTYQWTLGTFTGVNGGSCSFVNGISTGVSPSIICNDNGTTTVSLVVTDNLGASSTNTAQATVTVDNVNPVVTITAPGDYSVWAITAPEFGLAAFVNTSFTDAGTNDTHTCTIDWGDGDGAVNGTLTETAGSGTCKSAAGNPYTDDGAGIYEIIVKVKDDDNGEGSASVTVIVYDPSAGFVTGGGWINSLAGYCKKSGCQDAEGKAHFGFVSKYQKGANVPTGQTEFQFQAGDLNLHSSVYEWLIVNKDGTNAQYKGTGTINGANDTYGNAYKFMLWGYDGTKVGAYDTFRIRIWSEVNGYEDVVYDNGGSGAGGYSTAAIANGSIHVQTGGKK